MTIKYETAVKEGKDIVQRHQRDQWRLGELAAEIEPKYGEQTLAKFAEAISIEYKTLKNYRTVFIAYSESAPRGADWAVARELAAQPDRAELVQRDMTTREARELVQRRRASQPARRLPVHTVHTLAISLIEDLDEARSPEGEWANKLATLAQHDDLLETVDRRKVERALKALGEWAQKALEKFQRSEAGGAKVINMRRQT